MTQSRPLAVPAAACPAAAQNRPNASPAQRLYNALRRAKGYSHAEATRHLRRTLKRYFRAA
ncbi:MAG TPA: hypothetical protein VN419_07880 [Humidesulfovibrio sp.]|uniref:hypothetical protein n=1 Tax=Humidesulfovibrio sp. TaxID=2910988 RepID=UPI002D095E81|nr:hypothetical protein [Humidesulfovibrio sp.]HWR03926.1 hypothetical protein [Humidesulfovibrio sp.]